MVMFNDKLSKISLLKYDIIIALMGTKNLLIVRITVYFFDDAQDNLMHFHISSKILIDLFIAH